MALEKGINAYVTVEEADVYFADRLDVAAWLDAPLPQKSQSLVTATSVLDELHWVGQAVSSTQLLAFPRVGGFYDPKAGRQLQLGNVVPPRITKATLELAYHLLNNDGILDDTGTVENLNVGSINLSKIRNPNLMPKTVKQLINPLLLSGGSTNWWRAN